MPNRRPSGDGMVRKRADGRWEGRIVVGHKENGLPIYKAFLARTQNELMPKLHKCIEDYRGSDLTEESRMTLGEWLDRWLNEIMVFFVRETTLNGYLSDIDNHIKPMLGDKRLSSLTSADIQRIYNRLKRNGRVKSAGELSDATVRGIHMVLHKALDAAVEEHLIVRNPTLGTSVPKCNYKPKQILNDEQLDKFMDAIKKDELWYDFFYLEMTTGLRRGEICGLRWENFDCENGRLNVCKTLRIEKGTVKLGETKTDAGKRSILLPNSTAEMLRKRKEKIKSEWIFPDPFAVGQPINPDRALTKLREILYGADLPLIRFHDLRHTFATHALAGGVDPKTLSGILGHTNASFTLDTYTHVTTDMQKRAADVVSEFIEELI